MSKSEEEMKDGRKKKGVCGQESRMTTKRRETRRKVGLKDKCNSSLRPARAWISVKTQKKDKQDLLKVEKEKIEKEIGQDFVLAFLLCDCVASLLVTKV